MCFHVAQASIFRQLPFFIGHMDQKIKAVTICVPFDDRQKLLFMQFDKSTNRDSEFL